MTTAPPFYKRLTPQGRILDLSEEHHIVWSCSPIRDADGLVHVFFTRVPMGEDGWFKNFRTHGHIMHAVAKQPEGPYTVKALVLAGRGEGFWDAFGIVNPRIYRVEDQYALLYTAYEVPWPQHQMKEHIGILLSEDLQTWRRGNDGKPILSPSEDPKAWDHQLVNNASLVKDPDTGGYRLYYRGIQTLENTRDRIGVAMANQLEGPWRKYENNPLIDPDNLLSPTGVAYRGFEDPCVWIEGGKYCMLTKDLGYFDSPGSAYFESVDGLDWGIPVRGYGNPEDSPQLLFDAGGNLTHLFVNRHREGPLTGFVYQIDSGKTG
ncbi:glycoside hydrolase family protein [Kiritimatiellaeota bacterium B1221]|nr:glycoside hydrolase family protein [Kiritimatiellaeota bacterium B1221]